MKQRLIIAAALLHDPQILIIDEPMVGLDPEAVHMVKDILKDLAARQTTIFVSTHTLSIAEDLCHRIGLIHKGTLLADLPSHYLGWFAQKGFPKGQLGRLLALMHEVDQAGARRLLDPLRRP